MERPLVIVVQPSQERTLLLGLQGQDEILRASLGHASQTHRHAAPMLLEALALWHQQPLRVVLSVADDQTSSGLGISDGFGFGQQTLHYQVEVREHARPAPGRRLGGVADFRRLRRQVTGRSR